ncbi:MAG: shikimate dehydrogenase [Rhodospirillaceae bacterium]|jgi:shikimate dehydrogenase|nr:shikimate dehydrogenase [Rhodospirillaceae bacterium]MBT5243197.1 shikimate dehydrogenase [Rhodospirillaceae bacterium]MBT6243736.1 shikimate dehydrogenase [Rhodospirillaceae bacterium]MBT7942823.1 shikimate dehydrogenase [Alphaproteobacteria bacterium]
MSTPVRAACVMGWPVEHSRAPIMHGYWISKYGISGDYRKEAIRPEDFPEFVSHLSEHGYVGGNITQPHKEVALALSTPDDRARAIGAANVVWLDDDELRSTNTDGDGFITALDHGSPGWDRNRDVAVVIGAGGASMSVVYVLLERGFKRVHVVNRTLARAEMLRDRFGSAVHPTSWDDLPSVLAEAQFLANSSSLGMVGEPDKDWDLSSLHDDVVVADVVYAPIKTSLLAAAERRGLRTSDGLGMLLHQAGRGFELWFGVHPEVTAEQRALVEAALKDH